MLHNFASGGEKGWLGENLQKMALSYSFRKAIIFFDTCSDERNKFAQSKFCHSGCTNICSGPWTKTMILAFNNISDASSSHSIPIPYKITQSKCDSKLWSIYWMIIIYLLLISCCYFANILLFCKVCNSQ